MKEQKSWQARFAQAADALTENYVESLSFDQRLWKYDIAGSIAHAEMLAEVGLIGKSDCQAIKRGLLEIESDIEAGKFRWDPACEDIHMAVEGALIAKVGEPGKRLHTARSRNDQVALDLRLYTRDAIDLDIVPLVADLQTALVDSAARYADAVMPAYTHMQRAQPVLVAHHLLAYFFALERERLRFADWSRCSWMPLGAGALAGVNYPLDREQVAAELGFARVAPNAMDAVAARDAAFAYLAIAASCSLTLSRLAGEMVLWTTQEYGLAALPESWTSGSSIMPQKRNPDGAELVRAKAAGFLARLQGLGAVLKGLPLAYNGDLQEDKLYVFAGRQELDLCLEAMAAMVDGLTFDPERGRAAAEGGYSQATDVADYLVSKGLPFREAHRVVGRLVSLLAAEGRPFSAATLEELRSLCPLFGDDYYAVVDLDHVIAGKISPGGTAPERVAEQLALARAVLEGH